MLPGEIHMANFEPKGRGFKSGRSRNDEVPFAATLTPAAAP
jgi:hypothetical protein